MKTLPDDLKHFRAAEREQEMVSPVEEQFLQIRQKEFERGFLHGCIASATVILFVWFVYISFIPQAHAEQNADYWQKDAAPISNIRTYEIDAMPWEGVQAYTLRGENICEIIIKKNPIDRDCTLAHEKKHCAGWSHPKYPRLIACVR